MTLSDLSTLLLVVFGLLWFWELFMSPAARRHPFLSVNKKMFREPHGGLSGLSRYFEVERTTGVVIQKEGLLQKTYAYRGPDIEGWSDDRVNAFQEKCNRVLMRKGTGWAWHFEAQRMQVREYEQSAYPTYAQQIVEQERAEHFESEDRFYISSYYLTLVYAPPREVAAKAQGFFRHPDKYTGISREIDVFIREADALMGEISAGGDLVVDPLTAAETVSYLHTAFSWNWFPMRVPQAYSYLDAYLFDNDMSVEGEDIIKIGDHITKVITIYAYPDSVFPFMLEGLNQLGIAYRWTTRWVCMDGDEALREIDKHRKRFFGERKSLKDSLSKTGGSGMVNLGADSQYHQANQAGNELQTGASSFGLITTNIQIEAEILDGDVETAVMGLRSRVGEVMRVINACGFNAKVETANVLEAWASMQPGNLDANVRRGLYGSNQTTCILPFTAHWEGRSYNEQGMRVGGTGVPTAICATEGSSRFNLNLNVMDVWHFLVVGSTGGGKTTLLAFLILQVGKYVSPVTGKRARQIYLDYDFSIRQLAMAMGADRYEPGRPGARGFQPLRRLETVEDFAWAQEFIELLVRVQGIAVVPRMRTAITDAIKALSQDEPKNRRLSMFRDTIQYEEDGHRVFDDFMSPYVVGGPYGEIFDDVVEATEYGLFTVYELKQLLEMGNIVVYPALMYLFREIELSLDGTLTYLYWDEAWRAMREDYFVAKVVGFLKAGRKNNLGVGLCTQDLAEVHALKDLASALLVNCPLQFFLPNPGARAIRDAYVAFGLTDDQIEGVASSEKQRDYWYKSEEGFRRFQLDLGPKTLNIAVSFAGKQGLKVLDSLEGLSPEEITNYFLENGRFK